MKPKPTYRQQLRLVRELGLATEGDGCAFTVTGGELVSGEKAPGWLAKLNGCSYEEIVTEAIARKAVVFKNGTWRVS